MKQTVSILFILFTLLIAYSAFGDTPAPGTVKAKLFSGDGTISFGGTGTSLNVNVTNPGGGTQTVNQGTAGASAWPVSLSSVPLPTGAATETSLLGVNTNLSSILAKMPTLVGGFMPVAVQGTVPVSGSLGRTWSLLNTTDSVNVGNFPSSFGRTWSLSSGTDSVTIAGTVTATNSANGATGSAVPSQATQVGGSDGTSLRAIKVSTTGVVLVDGSAVTQPISASALPLPTNASTAPLQTTGNASLATIATNTTNIPPPGQALAGASLPVVLPAAQITTLTPLSTVTVTQATGTNLHTVVDSSALPSGAATSALQTSGNSSLSTIATNTTGAATAANQTTGNTSLGSIDSKTPALGQALAAASVPVVLPTAQIASLTPLSTVAVTQATGTNLHTVVDSGAVTATITGTPNVAVTSSVLPTGAATSANQSTEITSLQSIATNTTGVATAANQSTMQGTLSTIATNTTGASTAANQATEIASLSSIDAGIPAALGQTTMSASLPVAFASDQTPLAVSNPDLFLTGQAAQTATVNNILPVTAGASANDVSGYRSGSVQIVSTGTAGTFILEGSNDNVNFQTVQWYSQLVPGTPIITAVTATASQLIYTFPIKTRYIRVRIATTITGGSIQAFTRISQESWSPAVQTVAQSTAASLQATVTGTVNVGTVTTVTSDQLAIPGIIADVASAALTTTTTTATLTPTFGVGYKVQIPVTVVSGTTPTLIVQIQESADTGTNWTTVYTFPTISATGFFESPPLFFKGNRVRYVQTVAGTTPSFTRAINRLQMSAVAATPVNNNATFASSTVSTSCSTLTAPSNAVAFILENLSTNTVNMYWTLGATAATSSTGMLLEPGRDTGEVHAGVNISLCAASGTPTYSLQWVQQ